MKKAEKPRLVKIGLLQARVLPTPEENLKKTLQLAEQAVKKGAQIICTQELFRSYYFCQEENHDYFKLAEPIPGPTTKAFQQFAKKHDVVIIASIFEKRAAGIYHNSAAVIDADGALLGIYRKMHIPDDPLYHEKYYFTPGEIYQHGEAPGNTAGFRIFDTRYGRIGVLICWDQWYPEAARITALLGAQVIFYPTAIGWHPREKSEWGAAQTDAWRTIQRSHSIANGVYVAAANRVGHEPEPGTDGIEFFGYSFIADPFGRLIAEAGTDPAILVAEVDPARIEYTRRNWPFLRDRRIDAYGPILKRYIG